MKKFFLSGIEGIITDKPEEAVKLRKSLQIKKNESGAQSVFRRN